MDSEFDAMVADVVRHCLAAHGAGEAARRAARQLYPLLTETQFGTLWRSALEAHGRSHVLRSVRSRLPAPG